MKMTLLALAGVFLASGQSPVNFEVASVKEATGPPARVGGWAHANGCSGGPGTNSLGQYSCVYATLPLMISQAFGLRTYQLPAAGADGPKYDVTAKVRDGATKEQVRTMMQNLLVERFKLAYHFEKKEVPGYELVVAKGGPKLKSSPPPTPDRPQGPEGTVHRGRGSTEMTGTNYGMDRIVTYLVAELGRPITDATNLTGQYDFSLTYAPEGVLAASASAEAEPVPTLIAAIQGQLGLRLEPKKCVIDVFVVDHVEKTPTEN